VVGARTEDGAAPNAGTTGPPAPSDKDTIRRTLAAIRDSGVFGRSERRARLLEYLVETEISGRGDHLKAFTIAVDVFGRSGSFDPGNDSAVRVEISRLRDNLSIFYAQNDRPDLARIEIPKGTYRPEITLPAPAVVSSPPVRRRKGVRWALASVTFLIFLAVFLSLGSCRDVPGFAPGSCKDGPGPKTPFEVVRIMVMPFSAGGREPAASHLALGLWSELVRDLSAYPFLLVISPTEGDPDGSGIHTDFLLKGEVLWSDPDAMAAVQLVALPDHDVIWASRMESHEEPEDLDAVIEDFSERIVQKIAQRPGLTPALVVQANAAHGIRDMDAYLCLRSLPDYLEIRTESAHLALRKCLRRILKDYPEYGDAWAALAIVCMDEARLGFNSHPGHDAWKDARSALARAREFAPARMLTLNTALVFEIENPQPDPGAARRTARRLLELYPHHPGTLANVGSRLSQFLGDWDTGLALAERAIAALPDPPSWYFEAPAAGALLKGDEERFQRLLVNMDASHARAQVLLRYIGAWHRSDRWDMRLARRRFANLGLTSGEDIAVYVRARHYDPALEAKLLSELTGALAFESAVNVP